MQFSAPSPGMLVAVDGQWVARWYVKETNFGLSHAEAVALIGAALNDPGGWIRAGVHFQQVAPGPGAISFEVRETITYGGKNTIGLCTHYPDGRCEILIEYNWVTSHSVINHEAAHGYFFAEHSPPGSDSQLEPMVDAPQEDPSALDIAQVRAWLGDPPQPGDPPVLEPQRFWFPGNLNTYITDWFIPEGVYARMTATVVDPAPGVIRPVYANTHADVISGDRQVLCRSVSLERQGWHATEWQPPNGNGDLFVGLIVELEPGVSIDQLNIGHAEVQLSGERDDEGRGTPN